MKFAMGTYFGTYFDNTTFFLGSCYKQKIQGRLTILIKFWICPFRTGTKCIYLDAISSKKPV